MKIANNRQVRITGHRNLRTQRLTSLLAILATLCFLLAEPISAVSHASVLPTYQTQTDTSSPAVTPPVTPSSWRFLPLLEKEHYLAPPVPRPIGSVRLISGPTACNDQNCYELEVTCPDLAETRRATLKVGDPISQTYKGTILFATGWIGNSYWEVWSTNAPVVLNAVRMAGFRTVQLKWTTNWLQGAPAKDEGHARLACRPATVMQWVHDNLFTPSTSTAFCTYGHSNGAAQVSYSLAQYGMSRILSAVLLDAGPNWSRTDKACIQDDPSQQALWFDITERGIADWAFGFPNDGTGPCATQNTSYREKFQQASVAYGNWEYVYPKTMVSFVQGSLDQTTTAAHGRHFYNFLTAAGTPLIHMDVVPNASHVTVNTTEGANLIRDTLINECHPR